MDQEPESGGLIALPAAEFEALLEPLAETGVRLITTGILLALMASIAIKLKLFGPSP